MGATEGGRGGATESDGELMASNSNPEPMTLDEIGALLVKALLKLSEEERKRSGAALMENLKKPVGELGRKM